MRRPSAVLVAALLPAAALTPACSEEAKPPPAAATSAAPTGERITLPSGVAYEDIKVGAGRVAKAGDTVNAHATGWLTDGTKFWSSHDGPNRPVDFALRNPGVIQGWVEGVPGMAVGGVRKLWIPSKLGYGSRGRPPIPPDADLVFEVELVAVR
ncbi:MAG: FKBP-type peptidyl-prolyl cis-trans isomerase [Polyangiaceae bacterium]|nr:FKBP-type peptidyl-prolyl cis-trans isomerase [Polyangiaceae bacterium]